MSNHEKKSKTRSSSIPTPKLERVEDFVERYANNARFESTVFDLKVVFGEVDISTGQEVIKQHTGVTLPWQVIKLAIYYLQVNLMAHEAQNGNVLIPPSQLPPPFPPPTAAEQAKVPRAKELFEAINRYREEFLKAL